jgi:hypothetical protein
MDSIVDIVRMQVLSGVSNKDEKNKWKNLLLLAILGNYKTLFSQLVAFLVTVCAKLSLFKMCIKEKKIPLEKAPKSVVRLRFNKNDPDNQIFKEMLKKHGTEFDAVQLKGKNSWHVVHPKTIELKDDIFFRLEFTEKPLPKKFEPETSGSIGSTGSSSAPPAGNNKNEKEGSFDFIKDYDVTDSKGLVFSYSKSVSEILDYIHENYVPVEVPPAPIQVKEGTSVKLYNMSVGRATKFHDKSHSLLGEVLEFTISKNLNNIFLEAELRDRLMNQIERFNDPTWYAERGLPRTLGILLHGQPGCGKTSFIKALCAFMNRKVVIVDFKLVRTVTHLRNIFSGFLQDDKNDILHRFAKESTIYVFEDFDCMSDIFLDRTIKDAEKKGEKEKDHDLQSRPEKQKKHERYMMRKLAFHEHSRIKRERKKKKEKMEKKDNSSDSDGLDPTGDLEDDTEQLGDSHIHFENYEDIENKNDFKSFKNLPKWSSSYRSQEKITLADFLELLDGIVEMDGRIIIMTTNKREKMDSALVRPGRIDLDLQLQEPSVLLICEIFQHMYKHVSSEYLKKIFLEYFNDIPEKIVSTAKVINCFMYVKPESGMLSLVNQVKNVPHLLEHESEDPEQEKSASNIWEQATKKVLETCSLKKVAEEDVDLCTFIEENASEINFIMSSYGEGSIIDSHFFNKKYTQALEPSEFEKPQYIIIDFKKFQVSISSYTLVTVKLDNYCLYNWKLYGGNNGFDWDLLSDYHNDPSFARNGDLEKECFTTSRALYRLIKFEVGPSYTSSSVHYYALTSLILRGQWGTRTGDQSPVF